MTETPELRMRAIEAAAHLVAKIELDPPGDVHDLGDIAEELAMRWMYYVATGRKKARNGR